jgi:hypothetical protein
LKSASAQKCGGVHRKMMRNRTTLSRLTAAGHGGPADHRREGAGGAADDDVLRRQRFSHIV